MRLFLTALVLCVVSSQAWACMPVPHEKATADELIKRTGNIVLARIVNALVMSERERYGNDFDKIGKPVPKDLTPRERWKWLNKTDKTIYPPIKYTFEVIETIKGSANSNFDVLGYSGLDKNLSDDGHSDESFFTQNNRGRLTQHFANCVMMPTFDIGYNYLIFVDKPYHKKSFELILNSDDKWLQYVREKVKEQVSELSNE